MRNFNDAAGSPGADYYLVQDNVNYSKNSSTVVGFYVQSPFLTDTTPGAPNNGFFAAGAYNLEFADPATTTAYESSYTNGSSVTTSGSVGVSADGPNVTVGGSVTTSQSMTYNVPPTTIANISNLPEANPQWEFLPQNLPVGADFGVNPTWTWFIPRDAYPSGGTGSGEIQIDNFSSFLTNMNGELFIQGALDQYYNVPFPFSTWTVNPPVLTALTTTSGTTISTPISINSGVFLINGQNLYPSSVVAVLIGGIALPMSNVDLVDDTTIEVTVPANIGLSTGIAYRVEVNTEFNGNPSLSNSLSVTLQ
jgi:hypothetical protein